MVADLRGFARPFTAIAGFAGESAAVSPQVEPNLQAELNLEVARKVQVMLQAEAEVGRQAQVRTARPASQMRSCRFASGPPDAK